MAIKTYRPTTQTLRYRTHLTTDDITSTKPHKPLVEGKIRIGRTAQFGRHDHALPWRRQQAQAAHH